MRGLFVCLVALWVRSDHCRTVGCVVGGWQRSREMGRRLDGRPDRRANPPDTEPLGGTPESNSHQLPGGRPGVHLLPGGRRPGVHLLPGGRRPGVHLSPGGRRPPGPETLDRYEMDDNIWRG